MSFDFCWINVGFAILFFVRLAWFVICLGCGVGFVCWVEAVSCIAIFELLFGSEVDLFTRIRRFALCRLCLFRDVIVVCLLLFVIVYILCFGLFWVWV